MQPLIPLPGGVYAASLTPLTTDLRIDTRRLADHCEWLLSRGCSGIVFMGTTGEANSCSIDERIQALEALLEAGIPAQRIVVGAGCCALPDTLALCRHALSRGIGNLLLLPPFYYKNVSDAGLLAAFTQVIRQIDDPRLRIFLYHIPGMSGVAFSQDLIGQLAGAFPNAIAGIKDSSGDWNNMRALCNKFSSLQVFGGSERFLKGILGEGGAGCISATANVNSAQIAAYYRARNANADPALAERFLCFRDVIEKFPMIPALKQVMSGITGESGWLNMRPPHLPLQKTQATELTKALSGIGFPGDFLKR